MRGSEIHVHPWLHGFKTSLGYRRPRRKEPPTRQHTETKTRDALEIWYKIGFRVNVEDEREIQMDVAFDLRR